MGTHTIRTQRRESECARQRHREPQTQGEWGQAHSTSRSTPPPEVPGVRRMVSDLSETPQSATGWWGGVRKTQRRV